YLTAGKADAYRRDAPYLVWAGSIRSWVDQVLAEREDRLQSWRGRLRQSLGTVGGALPPVVGPFCIVLGDVPAGPYPGARETRARLALAVLAYLRAAATAEHPLVMFLDDLQWADLASLQLLQDVLQQEDLSHLLIVAAYRGEEVDAAHPLRELQARLGRM